MRDSCVLVVDDEPAIRAAVAELLQVEGYAVAQASNGADALAAIERRHPDLILLDMRMPILDGWAFAEELRRREIEIPIVVMTAARDASRWASEIAATAALPKPFGIDDLLRTVERARPS